jgi:hypothetical protein
MMEEKPKDWQKARKEVRKMDIDSFYDNIQNCEKKISLFIGTSINPRVVPQWKELVQSLLGSSVCRILADTPYKYEIDDVVKWIMNKFTVYEQGQFIVNGLGLDYLNLVHTALFQNLTSEILEVAESNLSLVAQICQSPSIESVFTYNYDNLLEEKLESCGFLRRYQSQYGKQLKSVSHDVLSIYHPHGFLPWKSLSIVSKENDIVFGLEEYHRQYYQQYNWQTTTQLSALQNNFCIFLFTSYTDIDMLRLSSFAREYSDNKDIYLLTDIKKSGTREPSREVKKELLELHYESIGVKVIPIDVGPKYLNYLKKLKKMYTKIEDKDKNEEEQKRNQGNKETK